MPKALVNVSSCPGSCQAAATSSAFGYSASARARLYAEYQWPRPRIATRHFLVVTPQVYRIERRPIVLRCANEGKLSLRMAPPAASTLLVITFIGVAIVVLL